MWKDKQVTSPFAKAKAQLCSGIRTIVMKVSLSPWLRQNPKLPVRGVAHLGRSVLQNLKDDTSSLETSPLISRGADAVPKNPHPLTALVCTFHINRDLGPLVEFLLFF